MLLLMAMMNFRSCWRVDYEQVPLQAELHMPETRSPNPDFNRAFGDAKKQAAGVAGAVSDAAEDLYGQAEQRLPDRR